MEGYPICGIATFLSIFLCKIEADERSESVSNLYKVENNTKHLSVFDSFRPKMVYSRYMDPAGLKPVVWVGSSRKDFTQFPAPVQSEMGYDLYQAQLGEMSHHAKPLKGFSGAEVMEIRDNYLGDTFRAVYTVRYKEAIYVLHAFQKKSKHGIATPKSEIDIVHQRLKRAEQNHKEWLAAKGEGHEA